MKGFRSISHQSGAALFVCLMLLVVMTILGISSMTTTTMEEKMAGSTRNKHISFQAAEAAVRIGEQKADTLDEDLEYKATQWTPITEKIGSIHIHPAEYMIEELMSVFIDETCNYDMDKINRGECPLKKIYKITAHGWGQHSNGLKAADNPLSTVQTTYRQ